MSLVDRGTRPEELLRFAYSPIRNELALVEVELRNCKPERFGVLTDSIKSILGCEGKRMRPALVILSAGACGPTGTDGVVRMATAAELFHTATLITDDILDGADTRRGKATINREWGTETAILSAQYLYLSALTLSSRIALNGNSRDFSGLLLSMARQMLSGEVAEMEAGRRETILAEQQYLEIVRAKTASLFSACSRAGAMLAGVEPRTQDAMQVFGENLGMAFQIVDDVLDLTADEALLGKPVGADARAGRFTLPLIHLLRSTGKRERRRILADVDCYENGEGLGIVLERSGSIDYSLARAAAFAARAEDALSVVSGSAYKESLKALLKYAVERDR